MGIRSIRRVAIQWRVAVVVVALAGLYWLFFALPNPLFSDPTSTVITDQQGRLLSARIADDGQWRFPEVDTVPTRFKACLLAFEDRNFYSHIGVSPKALIRATLQNIQAGSVVSGASTLTMQTIRLSRKGQGRTLLEKCIEIVLAIRLEMRHSKEQILRLYASHAPFGGNVVGLDAAAWRYFNRPASGLSWAESAVLAVLPNAPSLIFPGKNNEQLKAKRNRVLKYLFSVGTLDSLTYELALLEPLPGPPHALPQVSNHLMNRIEQSGAKGKRTQTTVDFALQKQVSSLLNRHKSALRGNQVYNAAALVVRVRDGAVLAYCGNIDQPEDEHGSQNDMITAERSTGSILKPFLYAAALDEGIITPTSLLPDIPTVYGGYAPQNYDLGYAGAVPAREALARSLNIPAVRLLHKYGLEKFHHVLKQLSMQTLHYPASHYGLSLILGGAEGTLWDMVSIYRNMAHSVNCYPDTARGSGISWLKTNARRDRTTLPFSVGSVYQTFEAMQFVNRPEAESMWEYHQDHQQIAWKTGTSFGYRDAWSIGVSSGYAVGVWVGNADGEGRPGLTGIDAAAPLLFNIYDLLPRSPWFDEPVDEWVPTVICKQSGELASSHCAAVDTVELNVAQNNRNPCPYCERVFLDPTRSYRVHLGCTDAVEDTSWFVLSPVMEWYYQREHPEYKALPPIREDCIQNRQEFPMRIIYPELSSELFLPKDFSGNQQKVVVEATHRRKNATIYWHLDHKLVGVTQAFHQLSIAPNPGGHRLTLIDDQGFEYSRQLTVVEQ